MDNVKTVHPELKAFNAKIRVQDRKLTFFIDHCPAHASFFQLGVLNGYICQPMPSVSNNHLPVAS
jgi:hypothetical protein